MANISNTVEIIFGAVDNASLTIDGVGSSLSSLSTNVSGVTAPLASVTSSLLKTETAILALAAAYGGFAITKSLEFRDAQIDLEKVLSSTDPAVSTFTDTVINLSEKYGITSANILQGIANFKQAGFSALAASKLQVDALDLVIAGDVSASKATELLISSLKGFNAEASAAPRFMEALNNVSNTYATSLDELATGMATISPIANKMGFTFEETTGLITPIIEVFRSGTGAANALKTGLLKLIDDSKPVGEALTKIGVSQKEANGVMRSGKDIFLDVAKAFTTLDEKQKLVITSQLVGVDQAAKMVTVFDNLNKVQAITQTALEKTGSVTTEVSLRLSSGTKQIDIATQSFNNLAKEVGDKLAPSFGNILSGVTDLEQAFRDIVKAGGLDPLFTELGIQGTQLTTLLKDIAVALPEAFNGLNFDDLISSFGNLKGEIGSLFDGLDPTNPEQLQEILQKIVDFVALLTNASSGVVEGIKPLFDGISSFLEGLANSDSDTQQFIGQIGGIATVVDTLLPLLDFLASGLTLVGGALAVLGGVGAISSLGAIAEAALATTLALTPVGLAIGAVALAAVAGVTAYDNYKEAKRQSTAEDRVIIETSRGLIAELEQVSTVLGVTISSTEELEKAQSDGLITLNKVTGEWEKAIPVTKDYVAEVENASASSVTWEEATAAAALGMADLGINLESGTGRVRDLAAEEAQLAKDIDAAREAHKSFRVVLVDGVKTVQTFGEATKAATKSVEEQVNATGKLTEGQRLNIVEAGKLKRTLAELANTKSIETFKIKASIDIADIEAAAKVSVAAFQTVADVVDSATQGVSSIFSAGRQAGDSFGFQFETQLNKSNTRADKALENASKLNEAEVDLINARTSRLQSGTEVRIDAGDLAPELQAVLESLISNIRVQAVSEGFEVLL